MSEDQNKSARDASLMLKIRADALKANLERVKAFLRRAPDRRERIAILEERLSELDDLAVTIDAAVYKAKKELNFERRELPAILPDLQKLVTKLQNKLSGVEADVLKLQDTTVTALAKVKTIIDIVADMKTSCFSISIPPREAVGKRLSSDLIRRTRDPEAKLTQVQDALAKNLPDGKIWETFVSANLTSQDIFAEYVDFLGGMALRDVGFDEGISQMAEDFIETYISSITNRPSNHWLALPAARNEAVARTLARIVRVGFPEWTIWALPFTAHAFWHVIATFDKDLLQDSLDTIPERFQPCLADAFATFIMGPAYAYAAFYLLLNPLKAYSEGGPIGDDTRAKAIVEMLASMVDTLADSSYRTIGENLVEMWTSVLKQAGAGDPTPQTASDNLEIPKIVESLRRVLHTCECVGFLNSQWIQVESLDQIQVDRSLEIGELRSVLNGMWKARIDSPTTDVKAVADGVRDRIMKKRRDAGAAPSQNVPSKVTVA